MKVFMISILLLLPKFSSEVHNPIDISEKCVFKDKTILTKCFWRGAWSMDELVFRTQIEFEAYGTKIKDKRIACETVSLPEIDFSKYSLLSKLTRGGCCTAKYERMVLKDSLNKKIIYSIMPKYEGTCEMLCGNFNWVLVPKILEDYTVDFLVNEEALTSVQEIKNLNIESLEIKDQVDSLYDRLSIIDCKIDSLTVNERDKK